MKKLFFGVVWILCGIGAYAQNVSSRTDEFEVDLSDPKKLVNSTLPTITWLTPAAETQYVQESKVKIKFEVASASPLKNAIISIKETVNASTRGTTAVQPLENERLHMVVERNLNLMDGENIVEVMAENMEGIKVYSSRKIIIGGATIADASKLKRTDYALIFATDQYDNWNDLVNPVFDSRTIAEELRKTYGFKVDLVENATQAESLIVCAMASKKDKQLIQGLVLLLSVVTNFL
jgi:hypothetical protein